MYLTDATLLHTNSWNYKVYMKKLIDKALKEIEISIYVVDPEGNMSTGHKMKRSKIITSKNSFEFLFDLEGDFEREDIIQVNVEAKRQMKTISNTITTIGSKVPIKQAHKKLSDYVKNNEIADCIYITQEEDENNQIVECCNIEIKEKLNGVIADLDLGYKKLELLKEFKSLGLLKTNTGRSYDYKRYDEDNNDYRVVCFKTYK